MAQCFLDKDRRCDSDCIAFEGDGPVAGSKPHCLFLDNIKKVGQFFTTKPSTAVSYPISAPPPEVMK